MPTCCKDNLAPWALKLTVMVCLAPTARAAVAGCRLKGPRVKAVVSATGSAPFLAPPLGVT